MMRFLFAAVAALWFGSALAQTVPAPAISQLRTNPAGARGAINVAPIPLTSRVPTPFDDSAYGHVTGVSGPVTATLWRGPGGLYQALSVAASNASWNPISTGYALPGDAASVAPSLAYGTCQIVKAYTGALIRVQRDSDNAQLDIPQLNDGSFDWATYSAFIAGTTGAVTTLYHQTTGTQYNATQATRVNMPVISPLLMMGRCPSLAFNGRNAGSNYQYLTIAAGFATTKNSVSAVSFGRGVDANGSGTSFVSQYVIGSGSDGIQVLTWKPYGVVIANNTTSGINYSSEAPEASVMVSSGAASTIAHGYGPQINSTAFGAVALTGGTLGNTPTSISGKTVQSLGNWECGAFLVYSSALSSANATLVVSALHSTFQTWPQTQDLIVFDGESNTQGIFQTYPANFVRQIAGGFDGAAKVINLAVSGQGIGTMSSNYAGLAGTFYSANRKNNVLVLWPGDNDGWASISLSTTIANFQTYVAAATASGYKVVVATQIARSGTGPQLTHLAGYNAAIISNQATYGYTLARVDLDQNIGISASASNTTYFSDSAHMTLAGHLIARAIVAAAIQSVWK